VPKNGAGDFDFEGLKRRILDQLKLHGHVDPPHYRQQASEVGWELTALDLRSFIVKGTALTRPRSDLPASLKRIPVFRVPFIRRGFLWLLSRLFEDQRKVNAAMFEVQKLQNDIFLRLARRVVQLESEVAAMKDSMRSEQRGRRTGA
jgi:hypothetical protein